MLNFVSVSTFVILKFLHSDLVLYRRKIYYLNYELNLINLNYNFDALKN